MKNNETIEMHAIAIGQVQGVGFRATVRNIAAELKLNGTVSNLPDGSVEIFAQGPRPILEELIQRLKRDAGLGKIESLKTDFYPPTKQFEHFSIIYGRSLKAI